MKIKVIDLLNMISKGEEVPERIKYKNRIFKKYLNHNCYIREDAICDEYLLDMSKFYDNDRDFYNDEVELIEEDKKIEKLETHQDSEGLYFYDKHCKKIYITCDEINFMFEQFNELIDAVNELKGGVDNGNS